MRGPSRVIYRLNPKNFRFHGLSTALFASFTLNLTIVAKKVLMPAIARSPARLDFT